MVSIHQKTWPWKSIKTALSPHHCKLAVMLIYHIQITFNIMCYFACFLLYFNNLYQELQFYSSLFLLSVRNALEQQRDIRKIKTSRGPTVCLVELAEGIEKQFCRCSHKKMQYSDNTFLQGFIQKPQHSWSLK